PLTFQIIAATDYRIDQVRVTKDKPPDEDEEGSSISLMQRRCRVSRPRCILRQPLGDCRGGFFGCGVTYSGMAKSGSGACHQPA
ncbi:hypothetical protein ACQJ2W_022850, partial [Pantoea agglomerans]|uniref:hypothetical protein n=1 Tax=Enterobacter agglomerans TaxID=549 RepID=UPI003EE81FFD